MFAWHFHYWQVLAYVFGYGFVNSPSNITGKVTQNGDAYEDDFDDRCKFLKRIEETISTVAKGPSPYVWTPAKHNILVAWWNVHAEKADAGAYKPDHKRSCQISTFTNYENDLKFVSGNVNFFGGILHSRTCTRCSR